MGHQGHDDLTPLSELLRNVVGLHTQASYAKKICKADLSSTYLSS